MSIPVNPEFKNMQFLLAAPNRAALPPPDCAEVAFAGRSNAGKSSALNAICERRNLARTSKTPGRTQAINFFQHGNSRLADLPGYGFARVPAGMKAAWQVLIEHYLTKRECLRGVILVMDARRPLTDFDRQLLAWGTTCELTFHLLLTKADKLSRNQQHNTLRMVRKQAAPHTAQMFSAIRAIGLEEARAQIAAWLGLQA
ncbi:MAG TPA: ribosome biogenesis GTP-binding protein YihA/YsxC [Salinisphaeraceae bacterium]|nr:ribosome biogenesis GTP-binding protein YihA/YsxC [Salinisphaeraceae bacterium]